MYKILSILEDIIKPLYPWALPRNVDIEITNLCNLQCDMCPRQGFKKERKVGTMSLEQFRYVLKQLKDIPGLSFSGNGEATLHPEFMEFFHMARETKKQLTMSTNGLTLIKFSEEALKEFLNGFYTIAISMDSPYRDKYEAIRKGASFALLLEGIKKIAKIMSMGKAIISIHLVYRDQMRKELEDMIEFVRETGLNKITVGKLMHYAGSEVREKRSISMQEISELKKFANRRGIDIFFYFYKEFGLSKKLAGCNWPWRYAFISYEGIVTPCCSIKDPTQINLGNVFEDDFRSIWHGESLVEFRKNIRKGFFPPICKDTRCWFVDMR